jgi:hypothetical protein
MIDKEIVKQEILFHINEAEEKAKEALDNLDSWFDKIKVLVSVSYKIWLRYAAVAVVAFILGLVC